MQVSELIAQLQDHPPDWDVRVVLEEIDLMEDMEDGVLLYINRVSELIPRWQIVMLHASIGNDG